MESSSSALLPDLGTQIVIPVCAVVGIVFSLVQWAMVTRVKVSRASGTADAMARLYARFYQQLSLIDEEDWNSNRNAIANCAEIQKDISEGQCGLWL